MKKPVLISLIVVLLVVFGVLYLMTDTSEAPERMENTTQQAASQDTTPEPTTQTAGAYIEYSQATLADTEGTKLLFFHAPWCPQCRDLEDDIESKGVPSGVTILKVDYDTNQSLRQKYGVTIQTTVVRVDADGNLVEKFVAYDEPTIAAVSKALL
jgi:thioredoxin-like negative regulator of GroEL